MPTQRHRPVALGAALLLSVALSACTDDPEPPPPLCYERDLSGPEICALLGDACAAAGAPLPFLSEWVTVVPSAETMPEGVVSQPSHNNLDITWHQGRLFFAFRTGPTHFASEDVMLYVVSTTDQETWTLEATFDMDRDLREPRFLSLDGRLFLYFALLGTNSLDFEPEGTVVSEYEDPCTWSEPESVLPPGFIAWRARVLDGTAYLMGYDGGENIYDINGIPLRVHWLTTTDGRTFDPVVPDQPVVLEGGVSETDFAFADDGAVIAVGRNEAGDADGWGSKICRGEPGDLGSWTCNIDPKKYDSPLVFNHNGRIWLIGRRHVTADGNYDLFMRNLSPEDQTVAYSLDYWFAPKRCSLWEVDPTALTVSFVLDLPSAGDTCFASAVHLVDDQYLIYNYTSPPEDPDIFWISAQTNPTFIYRLTLTLP